ncbi:hypothetical protein BDZ91DRAFT_270899 [Kalaharituber pfeilii]|nr:hypothetical protein BDZ91DRAFT_270899 [Kalaharituber pfeilii]
MMIYDSIVEHSTPGWLLMPLVSLHSLLICCFILLLDGVSCRAVRQDSPGAPYTPDAPESPNDQDEIEDKIHGFIDESENNSSTRSTAAQVPIVTLTFVTTDHITTTVVSPPLTDTLITKVVTVIEEPPQLSSEASLVHSQRNEWRKSLSSAIEEDMITNITNSSRASTSSHAAIETDKVSSFAVATITAEDVNPTRSVEVNDLLKASSDKNSLTTPEKIGIGVGVPLGVLLIAFLIFSYIKRHLLCKFGATKGELRGGRDGDGRGFAEVDGGWLYSWLTGKRETTTDRTELPYPHSHSSSHCAGTTTGPPELDAWGSLSGGDPQITTFPLGNSGGDSVLGIIDIARGNGDGFNASASVKSFGEKKRPAHLQSIALPSSQQSFVASPASPISFPRAAMRSTRVRQGESMSSKSSSTLGISAFFNPAQGHERHGSASTRRSAKSRKGSVATLMTSNFEMEMSTLSSASEPQFPATPRDHDLSSGAETLRGKMYSASPRHSYFDIEREEITPIRTPAYIPQPQSPVYSLPPLPSPSITPRHRHSRTSSSGINIASCMGGMSSPLASQKQRPGTSPLASSTKGKTMSKKDVRIINHETTYFDDRDDDEDDADPVHSNLPPCHVASTFDHSSKRNSRRHSAGIKRVSRSQSDEVDGEEVWTDTDEERDSLDFEAVSGGLDSRFGSKKPVAP